MLDFRYHALSLVAVFLALAIGIVLGVTIGDSLVTDAERGLRGDLRANVEDARSDASKARQDLKGRDRMIDELYPQLATTRLSGERVAIVSWGRLPGPVEEGVRDAVSKGGGRLDSRSVFDTPLTALKTALGPDAFAADTADGDALASLGRGLARSIAGGGRLARSLRGSFPDEFDGRFQGADAVVFYEAPAPTDESDADGVEERADDRARAIESAMVAEFRKRMVAVVGVEAMDADTSQIGRYKSLQISSSDSVDKSGGRLALVFALQGAKGNFGLKPSAEKPLPDEALTP